MISSFLCVIYCLIKCFIENWDGLVVYVVGGWINVGGKLMGKW